jgi:hypothetical protein
VDFLMMRRGGLSAGALEGCGMAGFWVVVIVAPWVEMQRCGEQTSSKALSYKMGLYPRSGGRAEGFLASR